MAKQMTLGITYVKAGYIQPVEQKEQIQKKSCHLCGTYKNVRYSRACVAYICEDCRHGRTN